MIHRLLLVAAAAPVAFLCAAPAATAQTRDSWTGWYVGANVGGALGDAAASVRASPGTGSTVIPPADASAINTASNGSASSGGFTGGIEGGLNWVNHQGILFGVETDLSAMDVSVSAHRAVDSTFSVTPPMSYALDNHLRTDWMWTVRPRVGYAMNQWLVYGTAGLALADVKNRLTYEDTSTPGRRVSVSSTDTKAGWVAGLGAAYAFSSNWSLKGEWLYADFGSAHATANTPDGFVTVNSNASVRSNLFRAGLDYRF